MGSTSEASLGGGHQPVWILVPYNSLPDSPRGCKVFSPSVMHRDFFECNPASNGQKSLPRFELMTCESGGHRRQVRNLLRHAGMDKYVVFYTRHTRLSGKWENKIVGYFKVPPKTRNTARFHASEFVLFLKEECVPIPRWVRGALVSWGDSKIKTEVQRILRGRKNGNDASKLYQCESAVIAPALSHNAGQRWLLRICSACTRSSGCHWGRKTDKAEILRNLYTGLNTNGPATL